MTPWCDTQLTYLLLVRSPQLFPLFWLLLWQERDQCRGVDRCTEFCPKQQRPLESRVSLFFVWLKKDSWSDSFFLHQHLSTDFDLSSKLPTQKQQFSACQNSKVWFIHVNKIKTHSGPDRYQNPCQEYPASSKHNPPASQYSSLDCSRYWLTLAKLGRGNDTETVMRRGSHESPTIISNIPWTLSQQRMRKTGHQKQSGRNSNNFLNFWINDIINLRTRDIWWSQD